MAIPPVQPHEYADLFHFENERLLTLLRSLEPADWSRPTRCPGWDVHGLTAHLVGGSFSVISWLRDGFRGTRAPDNLDEAGFVAWLDELQDHWVLAARRMSPPLVIEVLEWSAAGFLEALRRHDPGVVGAHVSWAGNDPVPMWLDHARELTEKWIHRQQILEALDRPSDLRADLLVPVLDALRWAFPFRLDVYSRPAGTEVEVAVGTVDGVGTVDAGVELRWNLTSDGRSWTFAEAHCTEPAATIRLTPDQAWRLLTNNYDPAAHGSFATSGDAEILDTLLQTRAIIGVPK